MISNKQSKLNKFKLSQSQPKKKSNYPLPEDTVYGCDSSSKKSKSYKIPEEKVYH